MIYIACPANVVTGGPTLSHQMCYELNRLGYEAKMFYYGQNKQIEIWQDIESSPYAKYGLEFASSLQEIDKEENTVIIPEMAVPLREVIHTARVCVWWMSVDGYLVSVMKGVDMLQSDVAFFKNDRVLHFVQSKYAYEFVTRDLSIDTDRVLYLTDYIDDIYLEECYLSASNREDKVYYNYTKRGQELPVIMEQYPDIEWVPVKGMTMEQVRDSFCHGKVYVDFGMHPGKDRMPREAASCGLCIITNRKGSAGNDEDVSISDEYKFEDPIGQMDEVVSRIYSCMENYDERIRDFESYRRRISEEKDRFIEEVETVAEVITR